MSFERDPVWTLKLHKHFNTEKDRHEQILEVGAPDGQLFVSMLSHPLTPEKIVEALRATADGVEKAAGPVLTPVDSQTAEEAKRND